MKTASSPLSFGRVRFIFYLVVFVLLAFNFQGRAGLSWPDDTKADLANKITGPAGKEFDKAILDRDWAALTLRDCLVTCEVVCEIPVNGYPITVDKVWGLLFLLTVFCFVSAIYQMLFEWRPKFLVLVADRSLFCLILCSGLIALALISENHEAGHLKISNWLFVLSFAVFLVNRARSWRNRKK